MMVPHILLITLHLQSISSKDFNDVYMRTLRTLNAF